MPSLRLVEGKKYAHPTPSYFKPSTSRNRAKVSVPKAKSRPPGISLAEAQSVMGMVMLNRNTAATPARGTLPKQNSRADRLKKPMVTHFMRISA